MDDVLIRILSLIPKKENGDFKYGAKKKFCDSIGISQQNLSDWIAGRSEKYYDKLYEISNACGVSVEWLKTGNDSSCDNSLFEDLQLLRERPEMRLLLKNGHHLNSEQIKQFAELMKSIPEG